MAQSSSNSNHKIDAIATTSDTLTSRGGLALFVKYLSHLDLFPLLERWFGSLRKSRKGTPIVQLFKELFCFFLDGTSSHLTYFDVLKTDPGYAAVLEESPATVSSSHTIKRFFAAFSFVRIWLFRHLLQRLFLWRLQVEQPAVIYLDLDVMPMDNDDAAQREGVQPTYTHSRGFAPLQLTWGPYVIDAVFRGGAKHSNHGDTVAHMIRHVVRRIR
ncbi:MAG TPA: transposase, partial [bacterium]|nr:transposase [bacterium]